MLFPNRARTLCRLGIALPAACLALTLAAPAQVSLYTAVDLARRNSSAVRIAQADVLKASAALSETRDAYVPSLTAGSSAGYSYGFLGGVPSVFNAQIQSLLISFSQPDYIRAARAGLQTATLNLQDALDQVALDTALDYLQLNTITQQLLALELEANYGEKLSAIEQARLSAGVESQIAATRGQLVAAQADLRRIDLQAQVALLRKRLSNLTGLPEDTLKTEPESIPPAPAGEDRSPPVRTAGVDAGFSNALSRRYTAHGDARVNYRPQIGFAFTYEYVEANLNNYNKYYPAGTLRPNNFGIAAQISFPLFNAATDAHARGTAADAIRADEQAVQGRELADEQSVQLRGSLPTLRAQSRIAELQLQLAQQQLTAVSLQEQAPPTAPGAAPLNPSDELQARINERLRYIEALDARFLLLKTQLASLRMSRQLNPWINLGAR